MICSNSTRIACARQLQFFCASQNLFTVLVYCKNCCYGRFYSARSGGLHANALEIENVFFVCSIFRPRLSVVSCSNSTSRRIVTHDPTVKSPPHFFANVSRSSVLARGHANHRAVLGDEGSRQRHRRPPPARGWHGRVDTRGEMHRSVEGVGSLVRLQQRGSWRMRIHREFLRRPPESLALLFQPCECVQDPTATNMDECIEYVARAETGAGVFAHQSEHALFQISTPKAAIRLSHGRYLFHRGMKENEASYHQPESSCIMHPALFSKGKGECLRSCSLQIPVRHSHFFLSQCPQLSLRRQCRQSSRHGVASAGAALSFASNISENRHLSRIPNEISGGAKDLLLPYLRMNSLIFLHSPHVLMRRTATGSTRLRCATLPTSTTSRSILRGR